MILRIRSAKGVQRVKVETADTVETISKQITTPDAYYLSSDPAGQQTLSPSTTLSKWSHGDFIFLHEITNKPDSDMAPTAANNAVDQIISKRSGIMRRSLDARLCRHASGGMCEHCQPLEPWQISSVEQAKHLPLHVWSRKTGAKWQDHLEANHQKNRTAKCTKHANDQIMCSKCLSPSITLNRQLFRLVDHVEFCGSEGVEQVVGEWRRSGMQRFAWLYGSIVPRSEEDWDLGIKVIVQHVYQPAQDSGVDGVKLLDDAQEQQIGLAAAAVFGLQLVGCLYTDLHDDGTGSGSVQKRDYFVSSPEVAFMADQQSGQPRFVTCIASGSATSAIEVEAYMASEAAIDYLSHTHVLTPSTDPCELMVKGSTSEFVYTHKNEYGYEVPVRAKPGDTVPVDYFLVSLTHGFSTTPLTDQFPPPFLHPSPQQALGLLPTLTFNLLAFLYSKYGIFPLENSQSVPPEIFQRLLDDADGDAQHGGASSWTCPHCTFINVHDSSGDCAMCGLPKDQ